MTSRQTERRKMLLDLRDNFEIEYELVLVRMKDVVTWLDDPDRKWNGPTPMPEWVRGLDKLPVAAAIEKVRVRALAFATADTIINAVRPDLDDRFVPPSADAGAGGGSG